MIGRKNWLFSDTPKGATTSAQLYSQVETAKANGKEPYAWLRHALEGLPTATSLGDYEAFAALELRNSTSQLSALPIFSPAGFMERLLLIAQLNHAVRGKHGLFEKHRWFAKNTARPVNQIVLTRLNIGAIASACPFLMGMPSGT